MRGRLFVQLVSHDGCLYALDTTGKVWWWKEPRQDLSENPKPVKSHWKELE